MSDQLWRSVERIVTATLRSGVRAWLNDQTRRLTGSRPTGRRGGTAARTSASYPGDFEGMPPVSYEPLRGDTPDPGEIVWTWVPYEEDHSRGKDRPVLLVGREAGWLLGLQLTSKDHDRDARQEASDGRYWMDIGTGAWDREGRASEVRLNRVIRVAPDAVRRVSVALPQDRFDAVVRGMREHLR